MFWYRKTAALDKTVIAKWQVMYVQFVPNRSIALLRIVCYSVPCSVLTVPDHFLNRKEKWITLNTSCIWTHSLDGRTMIWCSIQCSHGSLLTMNQRYLFFFFICCYLFVYLNTFFPTCSNLVLYVVFNLIFFKIFFCLLDTGFVITDIIQGFVQTNGCSEWEKEREIYPTI